MAAARCFVQTGRPMLDLQTQRMGSYDEIVLGLQETLQQRLNEQDSGRGFVSSSKLPVLIVGHGGRDTLCGLAVLEAAARDATLRNRVQLLWCTCSWADDQWEGELNEQDSGRGFVSSSKLPVLIVGHGGRDTLCGLAVLEAAARDATLRNRVQLLWCTCSWADDQWEGELEKYLEHLRKQGCVECGAAQVILLKFHREHDRFFARLGDMIRRAGLVLQCEQGVDFFQEPLSSQYLQDLFEDHSIHDSVMREADKMGIPVFLLQTNSELDLCRGINQGELNGNVFQDQLQTNMFNQKICFPQGLDTGEKMPQTVIEIATKVGGAPDKNKAFQQFLGIDLGGHDNVANCGSLPRFYPDFIQFCARSSNETVPVAGVLELLSCIVARGQKMPWTFTDSASCHWTPPQWLAARLLQPSEVPNGRLRVLTEFRDEAALHTATNFAEYLQKWMHGRRGRREMGSGQDTAGRFARCFRGQLLLAGQVAVHVRGSCTKFDLWDRDPNLLSTALAEIACKLPADSVFRGKQERLEEVAKGREADYEHAPLAVFTMAGHIHILDFACRLLESEQGIHREFEKIWQALPARGKGEDDNSDLRSLTPLAKTLSLHLTEGLIAAWRAGSCSDKAVQ
eukprot:TRINITY_DN2005_c0_g1_i1.p1 TRINITY_DN2005_c0_g1~~TRINITY_DN2005_c0_g1_i1.p1  ORF type:complete len:624 (-),score=94.85 TRINITY_DN2005_c0_g1_i1:81-1952(-)